MTDHHYSTNSTGDRDMFKVVMMVAQGIILPFLVWLGVQIVDQRESIARLEERLANQVVASAGVYTNEQASADRRTQAIVDQAQDREIGRLEERMTRLIQESQRYNP